MPIFYDRVADQIEELLPEFYQTDGPRFVSFIKAYFEFLEKGQLIYKDAADIDYIGLEDGTVVGEAFNTDGQRGNLLQESGTYAPSSITSAKFNYEHDVDTQDEPVIAKTSFEKDEYVIGSSTGALGRIDVIGNSSNLYIEQFSEAQFDIDETIIGSTSKMEAKVASFKASPLHAANNLLSYADVDKTSGDFIEYFRRDFMPFIDRDVLANKRLLQKHVKELYLSKGTKESYEFLFRILYGEEAEVVFPGDNVIKPSESEFSEPTVMRLYSTHDLTKYKRGLIKKYTGSTLTTKAYINDASGISNTNDSENAYELELVVPFTGTFTAGDSVILSDRDGFRIDAAATVRGVMSDIDPTESSIYVGLEDGVRGDNEDVIRLEDYTPIYILNEDGSGIDYENGIPNPADADIDSPTYGGGGYKTTSDDALIFEHALGGQSYQARAFGLETGTGIGILLTEESDYDINGNLVSDYALLNENTDLYENWDYANNVELGSLDPLWKGGPATRKFGGGVYQEQPSLGSLYSESDTFNYKTPVGGVATQSINVIGGIGRGGITEIILDDAGSGYAEGDQLVFVNSGTDGGNAEAQVKTIRAFVSLESGTLNEHTIYSYTATASQTVFLGRDNAGLIMGFDPRKVKVYVNGTEKTRETQFTTDQSGGKITLTSGASNNDLVEIYAAFQGIRLEDGDNPNSHYQSGHPNNNYMTQEADGTISKIQITHPGENYKSLPKVFMGGYIYYDEMTVAGSVFSAGEVLSDSQSAPNTKTVVVVKHDTEKKRILVYKRSTDPAGVPTGTVTGGTSSNSCVIVQTNVTAGTGAKLWTYGDNIGSVKKLKMQDVGHNFVQGGIGNYKQHAVIKDMSDTVTATTIVTANLTGATGTIDRFDGDLNLLTLKDVKGLFNDGDYCTTSDSKNFIIGKINPCTARGKLAGTALYDGNYTNDIGFPSVDSMRIHDSHQYQDFSYKIKVGRSINEYRSLVKSLLSPAGTIMFGEVSIRNTIDASALIYNVNFDGTKTTRSFIPTLIIGSRIELADIQLERATIGIEDDVFGSGMGRIELEDDSGVITTQRYICTNTIAADHSTHTVKDQSNSQPYVIGTDTVLETDRNFYERVLTAEGRAKGHKVTKELDISPHWNQHKISYTTLANTLPVGTIIRQSDANLVDGSQALGKVVEHNTSKNNAILRYTSAVSGTGVVGTYYNVTGVSSASGSGATFDITLDTTTSVSSILIRNTGSGFVPNETITFQQKHVGGAWNDTTTFTVLTVSEVDRDYIIVSRDFLDIGKSGSLFDGVEDIRNVTGNTNYITGGSNITLESHWVPEDIMVKREPPAITASSYITSQAQKTATEGGGDTVDLSLSSLGFHGRGKVLTASDRSETYDSELRQRKVNIISSPIFSQSATQRGRTFSAGVKQTRTLNTQNTRTEGTNTTANNSNGSALRIDSVYNTPITNQGDPAANTAVFNSVGVSWGHRPAGQKLFETTNFLSEQIVSENQEPFIMEPDHGQILGEDFSQGGITVFEDNTTNEASEVLGGLPVNWETATIVDETFYFVSEESTQIGSYNLIGESGERVCAESGNSAVNSGGVNTESGIGLPLLTEEALMAGQKESNQSGPSIGDLGNMMFSENYGIMEKVRQESGNAANYSGGINIETGLGDGVMFESGSVAVNSGGVNTESGLSGNMIQEALSEGLRISDISTIYPNRFVSNLQRELGRRTNLNHSAVIQTG